MKKKLPDWWPETIHPEWYPTGIFDKKLFDNIKAKLGQIGIQNFKPEPKQIFKEFSINPNHIKMILVNNVYPLSVDRLTSYEDYPVILKEMWDELSNHYNWEKPELYTLPDLSDFLYCLKLNVELSTNSKDVYDVLMDRLFEWFSTNVNDRFLFVFMQEDLFNKYNKRLSKHESINGFNMQKIESYFKNQWGIDYYPALPF